MLTWQKYCDECKKWGMSNPYPDESAFNRAYGISDAREPIVIIPKRDARKVEASFDTHIALLSDRKKSKPKPKKEPSTVKKEPAPKKPKAEAKPKAVKPPKPIRPKKEPKPRKTEEEKRAYRREWMRKFREKNPCAAYKYTKAWKEKNPDQVREWNRLYMRRKRAALKASGSGTTTTKPCAL